MAQKFKLILEEKIKLSETTHHFRFKTDIETGLEFKAGQFISLHIEKEGKEHRRNYSIANSPQHTNVIEMAMAYLPNGLASTLLENLQPGESVDASGPYGQFILKDETLPRRYVLIGTGTGITPYRSMLPHLTELLSTTDISVVIMQGVRSRADLLYAAEFANFAEHAPRARFIASYSRSLPEDTLAYEKQGYVQNHLAELNIQQGDIAYLCGNPHMVDEAFNALQELGLDRTHIRREKYISSK